MTLPSRICFSCVLVLSHLIASSPLHAGTVSGEVRLVNSSAHSAAHADWSGVVVWLSPAGADAAPVIPRRARMVQKNKSFQPHVLAVDVGSTVDFPNLDPIFHNAFSNFDGQLFDVSLYPPGSSRSIKFDRPGVVRVFCNIHPTMSATIVVLASPFFAITDKVERFAIPEVPAGPYRVHVFHERALPATLEKLATSVSVPSSSFSLPSITISEAGYLPMPHKNKYGRDYPAGAADAGGYSPIPQ